MLREPIKTFKSVIKSQVSSVKYIVYIVCNFLRIMNYFYVFKHYWCFKKLCILITIIENKTLEKTLFRKIF